MSKIPPRELEWMEIQRIMYGAVGQCAMVCKKCDSVVHFPNIVGPGLNIIDCIVFEDSCDTCTPETTVDFGPPLDDRY